VTGTEDKINAMIHLLKPLGIKKLTRSGILALYRELDESHRSVTSDHHSHRGA
jgi:acetolactate synthase-1/3 small subunit